MPTIPPRTALSYPTTLSINPPLWTTSHVANMNWTGGRLQRHSKGAAGGVVHRQKQHFAKARTRLQNGTAALSIPFRPSYFEDREDDNLGGRLPSFGRGSVRHVGHPKSRLHHRGAELPEPSSYRHDHSIGQFSRRWTHSASQRQTTRKRRGSATHYTDAPRETNGVNDEHASVGGHSEGKRKRADSNVEDRLIEANRRRLLKKQDWVGLGPSHPVNMHFRSKRDNDRIGKRRKLECHATAVEERRPAVQPFHIHPTGSRDMDSRLTRAPMAGVEDIKIRIGTDALMNFTSIQRISQPQGSGTPRGLSSDSMLFDTEDRFTQACETVQSSAAVGRSMADLIKPWQHEGECQSHGVTEEPEAHEQTNGYTASHSKEQGRDSGQTPRRYASPDACSRTANQGSDVHIAQHLGGATGPFRLIFEDNSDIFREAPGVMRGNIECDPRKNAVLSPLGRNMHRNGHGHENAHKSEGNTHASDDIDDGPWKAFLDIEGHNSSRSPTLDDCRPAILSKSGLQLDAEDETMFERTIGSQRATLGQETRLGSSSLMSPSLPSIKRAEESHASKGRRYSVGVRHKGRADTESRAAREGEDLWNKFVFADKDPLRSESGTGDSSEEARMSTTMFPERPTHRPPSSPAFGSAARMIDVLSQSRIAPHPPGPSPALSRMNVSQIVTSPVVAKNATCIAPRHRFGEYEWTHSALAASDLGDMAAFSVTLASLENNVSHNSSSSNSSIDVAFALPSGDSKTSGHGLDRRFRGGRDHVGTGLATRSEFSVDNIPSDEFDGVDPYKLT